MPSVEQHSITPKAFKKLLVSSHHWCVFQSQFCRHHRSVARWGLLHWGCSGQHSGWWSSQWGRPGLPLARFLWWASWSSLPASHCQRQKAAQRDNGWQEQWDCCQRRQSTHKTLKAKSNSPAFPDYYNKDMLQPYNINLQTQYERAQLKSHQSVSGCLTICQS